MLDWWEKNFATCELGDRRLNERAMSIGKALSQGFGKPLSGIFNRGTVLKRAILSFCQPQSGILKANRAALSNDGGNCCRI